MSYQDPFGYNDEADQESAGFEDRLSKFESELEAQKAENAKLRELLDLSTQQKQQAGDDSAGRPPQEIPVDPNVIDAMRKIDTTDPDEFYRQMHEAGVPMGNSSGRDRTEYRLDETHGLTEYSVDPSAGAQDDVAARVDEIADASYDADEFYTKLAAEGGVSSPFYGGGR